MVPHAGLPYYPALFVLNPAESRRYEPTSKVLNTRQEQRDAYNQRRIDEGKELGRRLEANCPTPFTFREIKGIPQNLQQDQGVVFHPKAIQIPQGLHQVLSNLQGEPYTTSSPIRCARTKWQSRSPFRDRRDRYRH